MDPPSQASVSSASLDLEIAAAKSYLDLVNLEWPAPSSGNVIWFESPACYGADWRLSPFRSPPEADEEIGALLCKTFFLGSLRNRLLTLSKRHGVNYSPPDAEPPIVWPERVSAVKKLTIDPCSAKEACVLFINEVKSLWRDESLVVNGFPFNDFCLNVLYTFGHLFQKVGLVRPSDKCRTFLFFSFRRWELAYEQVLSNLSALKDENLLDRAICLKSDDKNLHGSIFYSFSLYMNCIHIKKQILDIVQKIKEPKISEAKRTVQDHDLALEHQTHATTCCSNCDARRQCKEDKKSDISSSVSVRSEGDLDKWLSFTKMCPTLDLVRKSSRYTSFSYIEVTKFCSKELLCDWGQLSLKMKHALKLTKESLREGSCLGIDSNLIATSPKKYSWSTTKLDVKLMDFGMELWLNIEEHVKQRRQILQLISNVLENSKEFECLEIRGFPLLSDFSVSLAYILAHLFEKVRFYHTSVGRNIIFFFKLKSFPVSLREGLKKLVKDCHCITSLVPQKLLFSGVFYEKIVKFNNSSLQKQSLYISEFISRYGK